MNKVEQEAEYLAKRVDRFFSSKRVHSVIILLVFLIAAISGLKSYPQIQETHGHLFHYIDLTISSLFVIEIIARMIMTKRLFFKNYWSIFDLSVITAAILPWGDDYSALRVLRLLSSFHLLEIFPKTRHVIDGFLRSIPGLINVLFLEFVFIYTFSIMATNFYGPLLPETFGNVGLSMYSLFSMLGPLDWLAFAQPYEKIAPHLWIFLLIYIVIVGFILMNFVIGTIIDAMGEAAAKDSREKGTHELDNHFHKLSEEINEIKNLLRTKK